MKGHIVLVWLLSLLAASAYAAPINLGTASTFGLLGGSGVTNTGSSVINGDVGSSPTPAVTGFPPGIVIGTLYTTSNAVTAQAQSDLTTAYNAAAGAAPTMVLTGTDLGFYKGIIYLTSQRLACGLGFQGDHPVLLHIPIPQSVSSRG